MADNRPELAAPDADRKWYEGAGLVESSVGTIDSALGGEWGGAAGNAGATALGALGAVMDPLQAIFAAGVGWLIEHVEVLRKPLDDLCGNPKEIEAHAITWRNVQTELFKSVETFVDDVKSSTAEWTAQSADAYRHRAAEHATNVAALGEACEALSNRTITAGAIIGVVRNTLRDIIAEIIGAIISKALQSLLVVTIPKIVAEVAVLVAECTSKIVSVLQKLTTVIRRLAQQVGRLGGLMETLAVKMREAAHGASIVGAYRLEAAGTRMVNPTSGLAEWGKAYQTAFSKISDGHTAIHGTVGTVIKETIVNSARANGSQNAGSTLDKMTPKDPPAIDLPL
ncbi:hypothetical protein [Actinoplanes sp. NPDC048796]|uniref:hypothetical protein n=1 Tax=unclassified Actinoplanes TaxID=2626549 RepID=UPI0033F38802